MLSGRSLCVGVLRLSLAVWCFTAIPSFAGEVKCGPSHWIRSFEGDGRGYVEGQIGVQCRVRGLLGTRYEGLQSYLMRRLESLASSIQQGPTEGKCGTMDCIGYRITIQESEGRSWINIDQEVKIATDRQSRLQLGLRSIDIQGSGFAKYIRKVDILAVVTDESTDLYQVKILSNVSIEKPKMMPKFILIPMLNKEVKKQFSQRAHEVAHEVSENI